jgi:tetratricopeptide (TPR) repeat protein
MSRYWHNLDEAFFDVAEGIRKAIKKLMPSLEASAEIRQSKEIEPSQAALQTSQPATLPDKVHKTKEQWLEEGNTLYRLKRHDEALAAYEQALRLNPNDALAYNNKGYTLNKLKRYREALEACEQSLRLNPNDANTYETKGATLNGLKRYEEASTACEQALRLDPNLAEAYDTKGYALNGLNRKEEAQQAYGKARQLGYSG